MGIRPFSAGDRLGVLIVLLLAIAAMFVTLLPVSDPEPAEVRVEPFYKTVQTMHPADTSGTADDTKVSHRHSKEKGASKSRKSRKKGSQSKPAKSNPAPRDPLSDEIPTTR